MELRKYLIIGLLTALIPLIHFAVNLESPDQHSLVNRFHQLDKPASQNLLIIEIDDESLKQYNQWPWKRGRYADLLLKLDQSSPKMVVFDIDFSSISSFAEDQKFANAIQNVNYPVVLPAVIVAAQQDEAGQTTYSENVPLTLLTEHAAIANANAMPDHSGQVFKYLPFADNGRVSIANIMAENKRQTSSAFWIDYAIDPTTIPRYSVKDILQDNFNSAKIANKKILIGSTAIDLGDMYTLPKYGRLPGVYVHALAYETIEQGNFLTELNSIFVPIIAIMLFLSMVFIASYFSIIPNLFIHVFMAVLVYLVNVIAHHFLQLILPTTLLYVAIVISIIYQFFNEIKQRTQKYFKEKNNNNFNRAIINQVINQNTNGVIISNINGHILMANQKARHIFSIPSHAVKNREPVFAYIANSQKIFKQVSQSKPNSRQMEYVEQSVTNKQGQEFFVEVMVKKAEFMQSIGNNGKITKHPLYNFMITDMTEKMKIIDEKKQSELALIDLKNNDPITKLPNRTRFKDLLTHNHLAKMVDSSCMVVLISLDSLTDLIDIYGNKAADMALCQVASKIKQAVGERVTVARYADNIFGLIYNHINAENAAQQAELLGQVDAIFSHPFELNGHQILMSTSMGVVISGEHGNTAEVLINKAVQALDYAVGSATSGWFIYEENLAQTIKTKRELRGELQRAIQNEEFILYYQPQHNIISGKLIGYESLIRWQDPIKGLRMPDDFIPAAEEFGLILEIGEQVLKMGCHAATRWPDHITIAINVSPAQFARADMAALCVKYLEQSGLPAHRLELEITESLLMNDIDTVISTLEKVKKLGVKVSMDDFGTGYSSLQYLTQIPFDKIKIDRSFTMNIGKSKQSDALISSMISLGHSLDKTILAEGVESEDMLILLKAAGCQIGQGYYYGRPMPLADVMRQIALDLSPTHETLETHEPLQSVS